MHLAFILTIVLVFFDNLKVWAKSNECYELFKDIEKEQGLEPTNCKSVKRQGLIEYSMKSGKDVVSF